MQNSKLQFKIKNLIFLKLIKNLKFKIKNSCDGFTLIELLIVIVIIGILSTFLMANFIGIRQRARDSQRKSDIRQIQSALEMYRADQGTYPLSASFSPCDSPFTSGNSVTYMQKIPCDPIDRTSSYVYTSNGATYSIVACLENSNDQELDKDGSNNPISCTGSSSNRWQYTVTNP
ncbi:prepilin-type N-terminal cleavage/methylation domain-containing protein [Candidatus Microgenomates bacterium]|nr:MAG: prepilin-type N-terminal cleavage/methylation domain-containing protein [Candidatus Microgenomates bacterium]